MSLGDDMISFLLASSHRQLGFSSKAYRMLFLANRLRFPARSTFIGDICRANCKALVSRHDESCFSISCFSMDHSATGFPELIFFLKNEQSIIFPGEAWQGDLACLSKALSLFRHVLVDHSILERCVSVTILRPDDTNVLSLVRREHFLQKVSADDGIHEKQNFVLGTASTLQPRFSVGDDRVANPLCAEFALLVIHGVDGET